MGVNGTYVASFIWSYRGPTMYQKPASRLFLFRWQQRHWIVANLSQNDSFRDKRAWYYKAPSHGQSIPVEDGWSPIANGCGQLPAPVMRVVLGEPQRVGNGAEMVIEESSQPHGTEAAEQQPVNQCLRCAIM